MTARVALLFGLAAVASPARDWDFDDTVKAFERHYQTRRLKIPLFGLAQFAGSVAARPFGVKDFEMAIFERVPTAGKQPFALEAQPGWRPLVRVSERHGETVTIFARDEDTWVRIFLLTLEPDGDAVLMQFKLRPTRLMEFVARQARTD